ncbi:MAG: hypothetical protein GY938_25880, partial [Ketobacter sp.]|nr:hypothetical protein [Ketobacter sp.]
MAEVLAAVAAADGQHARRMGSPPRGRIRPVQHGVAVAVPVVGVRQSPAATPGVS